MNPSQPEVGPETQRKGGPVWLRVAMTALLLCLVACALLVVLGPALGNKFYQILQVMPFAPSP